MTIRWAPTTPCRAAIRKTSAAAASSSTRNRVAKAGQASRLVCVERVANTRHRHAQGGVAGATAFGLRRLVAAFVHERKPSRLEFDRAASKSASKLAHSKRWRATQTQV